MSTLLETLAAWRPFTAVVVGDFMLDQLVHGNAERLSPEAPVPVLHVVKEEDRPGGAANVCLDLVAMKGRVRAVGVVGADEAGRSLRRLLEEAGVDATGLVEDPTRPTTRKRSMIGLAQHRHPQKMFREDHESREPVDEGVTARLMEAFERAAEGADVVCIEDYGKGVCAPGFTQGVIERCKRMGRGIEVLVDPAAIRDYSKYRGATAITPNRTEAALAAGVKVADDAPPMGHAEIAQRLQRELDLDAAVITLDRQGALLLERGAVEGPVVVPTVARQVYDVTGAGDMVLAALAAGRVNKMGWTDAVKFANAAAGLEVAVFGVVPMPIETIHREVLLRERTGEHHSGAEKLRTWEELAVEVSAVRREGKRVVFTNGCFDILHAGHLSLLKRAGALGEYLVVAVNSDASVRRLKGAERPINSERDRAELLGGLECVDAVVVFEQDTPAELIGVVQPDVLVKGGEYSIDQVPGAETVLARGGRVELLPMVDGKSTTGVVRKIRAG
ncbi:MAG: D-glycero-beta-D-manno-heptose 1-phosphate adenylyltransferase [Phycisphaeraceae bacterium]|nr:D-glycero-beta-D-manno-heptose 1-phosphate adenylyltransferase [Phycisphaeraceae bacterium]